MAREKKNVHKVQMTDGKRQIIQQLLQEYDIETAEDIQDALKDLLVGTIKEMMEAEMDDHLGYHKSERSESLNATYRKLNRQRSVFPSDQALLKALYLSTFEATKKWTMPLRNWGRVYGELQIMYEGRLPE